jgi:predicted Zn-dependent protease with MMP-like domain
MSLDQANHNRWNERVGVAKAEVKATLASLPAAIKKEVLHLPITFERIPSAEMIEDGIDADTLGLFLGDALPDMASGYDPLPPQILLFLDNLWDYCAGDESAYRQEVRATLLHELGHYLGLDETDLEARGLD